LEVPVPCGDHLEVLPVDAGFHGEDAVEAPLIGGDAQDQFLFAIADGAEAVEVIVEEGEEVFGILVQQDVFVGTQAAEEAIAAGCGLAFGGAWAGGFLGVPAVGVDLCLGGCARLIRIFHIRSSGRVWPDLRFDVRGGAGRIRAAFCASD
jgi:hypothetical protein